MFGHIVRLQKTPRKGGRSGDKTESFKLCEKREMWHRNGTKVENSKYLFCSMIADEYINKN